MDHHFPGSSESSLSQPYEDARSRPYTPKTAASLLDFDSPSISPGSPARANWQPTLSPLADVTRDAGGIASGESAGSETERWASMEPDTGEHLLCGTLFAACSKHAMLYFAAFAALIAGVSLAAESSSSTSSFIHHSRMHGSLKAQMPF